MNDRSLAGRTILAVFAHPDDESLACGGTLARLADAGARVVLMCASRGERGSISDPALVPDGDLGRVRAGELREAAEVLGIAEVLIFDHPDGESALGGRAGVPRRNRLDHRASTVPTPSSRSARRPVLAPRSHRRARADDTAVRSLGDEAPPLYYVTMPQGVMRGRRRGGDRQRLDAAELGLLEHRAGRVRQRRPAAHVRRRRRRLGAAEARGDPLPPHADGPQQPVRADRRSRRPALARRRAVPSRAASCRRLVPRTARRPVASANVRQRA